MVFAKCIPDFCCRHMYILMEGEGEGGDIPGSVKDCTKVVGLECLDLC